MYIFFDTETNGLNNSSVLSISAIKVVDNDIIAEYNRFYYPIEKYNYNAIAINGLNYKKVTELRKNNYPRYFINDINSFYNFIKDATHFIGHNISFDIKFIYPIQLNHTFCTMHSNTSIIKIPSKTKNGEYKFPKLSEAADFYNIKYDQNNLHDSLYDVYTTFKIFKAMKEHPTAKTPVNEFIKNTGKKPILQEKIIKTANNSLFLQN